MIHHLRDLANLVADPDLLQALRHRLFHDVEFLAQKGRDRPHDRGAAELDEMALYGRRDLGDDDVPALDLSVGRRMRTMAVVGSGHHAEIVFRALRAHRILDLGREFMLRHAHFRLLQNSGKAHVGDLRGALNRPQSLSTGKTSQRAENLVRRFEPHVGNSLQRLIDRSGHEGPSG